VSQGRAVVRAAVHAGPAAAVTLNERLDYFGKTTRVVSDLLKAAGNDELVVSPAVAEDAAVIAAVPLTGAAPHRVQLVLPR
jgi:class 3 adenylate cyclase